jgi:hypothetical protein
VRWETCKRELRKSPCRNQFTAFSLAFVGVQLEELLGGPALRGEANDPDAVDAEVVSPDLRSRVEQRYDGAAARINGRDVTCLAEIARHA